ncbi:hypothetical protein SPRG_07861 [Saprolegnia parasitica CBS 223.65]|uniref:Uncharacterized protein n=1 Tax=Saprolegnia parasitica (strain CBS 223.65) TaxID=695850 RepID=A0A067C8R8_SAPPC|nr:hypothetical protein SPRG_07861 [Saprolegnia parasitica CBS 223.65]KDO27154.1 hypothetical protein SPRG_07861 [Saprolegnia parasitica CBS 223.65]|eukprot:XP_012202242.1 hypothetical protein SPRG_07861 [Saprolegnia parasitica CBS 223.65]
MSSVVSTALGLLYVLASLACCVYYTSLLQPSFANDLWWAGYNVSGYQAFLIDLCNQFLMTNANGSLDVLSASAIVPKTYSTIDAFTSIYTPYMHDVLLGELTSIEYAVPHLRTLSTYWSMRMNVQHCWVDFNKTFEMAHTLLRQERCKRRYKTNAAVYLEAILRNQPWDAFLAMWTNNFNAAIQRGLEETTTGRSFLAQMATAANTTSVADELTYWRSYNVSHFELQWQSRWQPGVSETIVVSNAIGRQENFTLKALDQVTGPWSTQNMFWIPLNDLFNAMLMNRSMVRGTSRYFGANVSSSLPAINLETYRGMADNRGNLVDKAWVFHTFIGPYLSIDIRYKLRPAPLVTAYNRFQDVVFTHLATSATRFESFSSLQVVVLAPTPPRWINHTYYGGDPACVAGRAAAYVQKPFGFYDDCSQLAWELPIPDDLLSMLESLPPILHATQAGFMQFATSANGSWVLLQQPLLSARDDPWTFYGWCFAADWATGLRQAVSFEGDVSSIVLLSNLYTSQHYVTSNQPLETATKMVYYIVMMTSLYLVSVGVVALLYTCYSRFQVVGINLLRFNRLVGSVWVGRQLMFIRGTSAILLLSAPQLQLTSSLGYTRMTSCPRSWLEAAVIAGEATWFTYSLHDLFVLVFTDMTRLYAPLSAALVWVSHVGLEDMDFGLLCTAGRIFVGSSDRMLLLLVLQVASVVLSVVITSLLRRVSRTNWCVRETESLLTGSAHAFAAPITSLAEWTQEVDTYDCVTCLLCGFLPITIGGDRYLLDLPLWILTVDSLSISRVRSILPTRRPQPMDVLPVTSPQPMDVLDAKAPPKAFVSWGRRWRKTLAVLGLGYVIMAIAGSVSYFEISKVNLANDLYWPNFNVTGHHAFFATWLNEQLVLGLDNHSIALDDPSINLLGSFAAPTAYVSTVHNYGTWLQHSELSSIEASIAGLRVSDACNAPWIFTPYCYLDWKKTWHMAYSHQRQMRCQKMESNAAVYLESVLRNIDWATFEFCWGNAFETAFGVDLRQTSQGEAWLHSVAAERLPLRVEAATWREYGLSTFQVQWQNYKRIGAINSYTIVNAYGVAYPMPLMSLNGSYRWSSQTTYKMYWSLANDLSAIVSNASGIGGLSLLRTSPRFAFTNTSLQTVLTRNLTLLSPLPNGLALVTATLGPFGVSDMVYVSVPAVVSSLFRDILQMTRRALSLSLQAQAAYASITPLPQSSPVPKKWLLPPLNQFGASILCQELATSRLTSAGLTSMLSFDMSCSSTAPILAKIVPTRQHYIVSAILSGLSASPPSDYRNMCSFDPSNIALCLVYLNQTTRFLQTYMPTANASFASIAASTNALVHSLNIELMIYAKVNGSAPLALLHTNLLDPSEVGFGFFAWTYLYDWVLGHREVISFQGDSGTLTVLTDIKLPLLQQVQPWLLTTDIAAYFQAAVSFVTLMILIVAVTTTFYMILCRGHFVGTNMLKLDRVGGIVWVGRPLLFLRSLTALSLLSTAPLDLASSGTVAYFTVVPTSTTKLLLAAWEVTWLATIVEDIALVATREYARYYVQLNCLVLWVVASTLSMTQPVVVDSAIEKLCRLDEIDFQSVCRSGTILIGRVDRLILLSALVLSSNVFCYVVSRVVLGPRAPCPATSVHLAASAKYYFSHDARIRDGVYYLDRASAVLNGLLTLRYKQTMYALDVKLWRIFVVPSQQAHDEWHMSYPLQNAL